MSHEELRDEIMARLRVEPASTIIKDVLRQCSELSVFDLGSVLLSLLDEDYDMTREFVFGVLAQLDGAEWSHSMMEMLADRDIRLEGHAKGGYDGMESHTG